MSNLAQQRIREAKENRLTRLDIGNCGLTEIPEEVFELTWLEELILSKEWREYSFDKKKDEWGITQNLDGINNIRFINPKIKALTNIKNLILSSQIYLSDLTPLKELTTLQQLYIDHTPVSDLSPLKNLTNLQLLYAENTQISDLSPLKDLVTLQLLKIKKTKVNDLSPLKDLITLQLLRIEDTKVSNLSPLKNLVALQLLRIDGTKVSDLSPLKNLPSLIGLNISDSSVTDLKILLNFSSLSTLIYNDLLRINYKKEKYQAVNNQQYEYAADLREMELVHGFVCIPQSILNPPNLTHNDYDLATIIRYFQEQDRVGLKKVNEARLLLVGQGNTGKTTLKDKLINRNAAMPEPDATTKGIEITPIICKNTEGSDFTVQVWDFGGQNIQKYAHQFFMSDSVVYAVLSNTREQNPNFQYWLNIIELLGKDSPFFIVQNEKDGHKEPLKDITQIQERFPQTFKGMLQVNLKDAATDPRFEIIEKSLFYAATQLPHTQKEYLTSFVNVRNELETLSRTAQSITFKQFKDLCKAEGIEDVELMNDYARTFTLLGIALHFADDVHLETQVFLRPKWIIDALFALLYAPSVENQSGRFSTRDVKNIWTDDDYEGMHGILLQLMEKFYLCYAIPHSSDYIVPQRLPVRAEPFVPTPDATHILYRYKFLPSGLLTQLTCRLHTRIEGEKVWNDAVQFHAKDSDGRVFVRENNAENSIEIFGFGHHKADLINTVVDTIDDIHQNSKFGNLKVDKLVPCPCAICAEKRAKQEEAGFFKYDLLIKDLQAGDTDSDKCEFSRKRFPIKTILKHASIRLFKIEQIKDLLEKDRIEDALKILRGQFQEDNEVIVQLSRLWSINRDYKMGKVLREAYSVEKNNIVEAVLWLLKEWDGDF
jgi:internalin A